jgi:Ca-activated chloride channel family protein
MNRQNLFLLATLSVGLTLLVAACSGAPAATPSPTSPPTPSAAPTQAPTATPAPIPTGPASLDAPDTVVGGTEFEVEWTGPNAPGDYVTIVKAGTTQWTNESYFDTRNGSPGSLVAPTTEGAYELWYVSGTDDAIAARRPITVSDFAGSLAAPDTVEGGTVFSVEWTGPNGPGDYITIVEVGAEAWSGEDYFDTTEGSPSSLTAPVKGGNYELWYVTRVDNVVQLRRPITVTIPTVTLEAPATVAAGEEFEVTWTGPNGPGDYITIVAQDAPEGTYRSYENASTGSPVTLTAPEESGAYEVRYVAGEGPTLHRVPITVN